MGSPVSFKPSDGYRGKAVLVAAVSKYDFRELGAYINEGWYYVGKVG